MNQKSLLHGTPVFLYSPSTKTMSYAYNHDYHLVCLSTHLITSIEGCLLLFANPFVCCVY